VVLHYLLAGEQHAGNVFVGKTLPDQGRDLNFLGGQPSAGLYGVPCALMNIAVASFARLRPSLMPARRNNVRRCCFTVRGLMFKWLAISLLLHPCTSRRNTCWSRGVILISLRLIMGFSSAPSVQSWGRDPLETEANCSPNLRSSTMPFKTIELHYNLLLSTALS